jgi:hypothetical protein
VPIISHYPTYSVLFSAIILLHEPHANIIKDGCISSSKILIAAKEILQQVHSILATSFDFTLLDWFSAVCALLGSHRTVEWFANSLAGIAVQEFYLVS